MLATLDGERASLSTEPDFREIMLQCRGMLAPAIYRELYHAARERPGGWIVEVGTANGAATVALALGLRDSGRPGRLMTFGRIQKTGPDTTLGVIRGNLERFGVAELVDIVLGEVAETAHALPAHVGVGTLMLDADGRIDRDFLAFYDRLLPGAAVVVDDVKDIALVKRNGRGRYRVDAKRLLTHRLVRHFKDRGLISPGVLLKDTYFGRKLDHGQVDPVEVLEVYRQLVFMDAGQSSGLRKSVIATLDQLLPEFMSRIRADYRDRKALGQTSASARTPGQAPGVARTPPQARYREGLDAA